MLPADLDRLHVPSARGGLVPLSALASGRWVYGSPRLERYNGVPAMNIQGEPAPGHSTGEAMQADGGAHREAPDGDRPRSGPASPTRSAWPSRRRGMLYAFSVLAIFLVLAALYESWTVPISIVLALPLGVIGGVVASSLRGLPNDVYFQIGLLDRARPDHEERHPDRAVRQDAPRAGHGPDRGDARAARSSACGRSS